MNMNQFTQKSIEALRDMQSAALENGNQQIEQVHLIHALISKEDGLIPNLITKSGASLEEDGSVRSADFRFPRKWIVYHEALQYFSV